MSYVCLLRWMSLQSSQNLHHHDHCRHYYHDHHGHHHCHHHHTNPIYLYYDGGDNSSLCLRPHTMTFSTRYLADQPISHTGRNGCLRLGNWRMREATCQQQYWRCVCVSICLCVHMYVCGSMCEYACVCMCMYVEACVFLCMYVEACVFMHVCV